MPAPTLDELMARWQKAREQGQPLTAEELCAACPELLPQVRQRLTALEAAVADLPASSPATATPITTPGRHPAPPASLPVEVPPDLSFLQPAQGANELGRLGPYRVLAVLGQGGLGITLRGQDVASKREVAIKVLYPELAKDRKTRQHFLREARNGGTLDHPQLVHVLHVDESNQVPYLVMPALKGESLARRLGSRPMPMAEAVRLGKAIAEALEAIHVRGLAHRDLKPNNVWLPPGQSVLLLDYGLARSLEGSPEHSRDSRLIGVAAYLAPEQVREPNKADNRADFFALGCLLYEMVTGRRAFPGETVMDVLLQIRADTPPDPLKVNAEVPKQLSWLIKKLLHKDPAKRPETARQILNQLDEIERTLALPRQTSPLGSSRGWWWLLAIVAGLVGAAVWWFWPRA